MGFVLALCALGIGFLSVDVAKQIEEGAVARSDSVEWTMGQVDLELLALELAVHDAEDIANLAQASQGLAELRKRFDIFFSRVRMLERGMSFQDLGADPRFAAHRDVLASFLTDFAPVIDGDDAQLIARLPELHAAVDALRPVSRAMSLAGLKVFAQDTQDRRLSVERTLLMLAGLLIVFILTLAAMVALLLRLDRQNRANATELAAAAARQAAIVGTAQDGVVTLDARGRVVECNAAAERTFGFAAAEARGLELAACLFAPEPGAVFRQAVADLLDRPGQARRLRLVAQKKSGVEVPIEASLSTTDPPGPRLVVAFLHDLTAQVAAEAALVQARDDALAGEKAKADLLAVMSHEVRTPLNGLLATLDLLGETRLGALQRDYLRRLRASGQILLNHVTDVLDISRLDHGQTMPRPAPLDLCLLAQDVLDNQSAEAEAKGNRLRLCLPEGAAALVMGDRKLLFQVLLNLVGNANKFTTNGEIILEIRHVGPQGPTEFCVSDTGIGIPAQDLDRIFDDFVTLDASYSRRQGGTGLGLGIARRIVAQLGGQISAESRPGQGASFRFTLPLTLLQAPPGKDAPDEARGPVTADGPAAAEARVAPSRTGLAVLVVEDNQINREVLQDMLRRLGHRATLASGGEQGLRLAGKRRFDLVLMDISMPGLDGMAATRQLRAQAGPNQATPVVAVTAHALPGEQQRFLAAGMQAVLTKPFGLAELARLLAATAPGQGDEGGPGATPGPAPGGTEVAASAGGPAARVIDRLLPAFLAEADATLAEIGALIQASPDSPDSHGPPWPEIAQRIHRLAGAAGLVGASGLARRLARIETRIKTGESDQAGADLAALPAAWARDRKRLAARLAPESALAAGNGP